ncbi:hypothetical protein COO60DRAFT_180517 [Scenedesmus sp. NREL 46B-D3]|nr:hypothetical protein COO60DRAFT_180517 [Scenedesmus sp. NREL 46B-D3]
MTVAVGLPTLQHQYQQGPPALPPTLHPQSLLYMSLVQHSAIAATVRPPAAADAYVPITITTGNGGAVWLRCGSPLTPQPHRGHTAVTQFTPWTIFVTFRSHSAAILQSHRTFGALCSTGTGSFTTETCRNGTVQIQYNARIHRAPPAGREAMHHRPATAAACSACLPRGVHIDPVWCVARHLPCMHAQCEKTAQQHHLYCL